MSSRCLSAPITYILRSGGLRTLSPPRHRPLFHCLLNRHDQPLPIHRFHQIVDHAVAQTRDGHLGIRITGEHDQWDARVHVAEIGNRVQAIDFWHPNVADHRIKDKRVLARIDGLDGGFSIVGFDNVIAGLFEHPPKHRPDRRLIVDHKDTAIPRAGPEEEI